jgi:glycosyltransferase involved in cell wall biosynthesis
MSNNHLGNKISCCLLTYNHVHIIESTINSILNQTIKDFEFIISDDCSTDGTWEKILDISSKFKNIKVIQTPKNSKMPGNCNYAFSHASKPYVALLHHDDLFKRELLEEWATKLELYPDVGFVFNAYKSYETKKISSLMPKDYIDGNWLIQNYLLKNFDCQVWGSTMIRKSCWLSVGGMREKYQHLADIDLWIRLSKYFKVGYVSKPVITIRRSRPVYYPTEYKGDIWKNNKLIYTIHADNIINYENVSKFKKKIIWYSFLINLNLDNLKWLVYAVLKKKKNMIRFSEDAATVYDFYFIKKLRALLKAVINFF